MPSPKNLPKAIKVEYPNSPQPTKYGLVFTTSFIYTDAQSVIEPSVTLIQILIITILKSVPLGKTNLNFAGLSSVIFWNDGIDKMIFPEMNVINKPMTDMSNMCIGSLSGIKSVTLLIKEPIISPKLNIPWHVDIIFN